MRRRAATLISLALAVHLALSGVVVGAVGAQNAGGGIGIRLVDAPADRADDPRAKVYIVDHVAAGVTIQRRLEVSNATDATRRIDLYAGAASLEGGAFRFGEGRTPNELVTWTRVVPSSVTLTAGEKRIVQATIRVPPAVSAGERFGVLWAESASDESTDSIASVNRVGVRVYLSVGAGGEPATDFTITGIAGERQVDGRPAVVAVVRNAGGRAVDLRGELQLRDGPGGLSAGPFPAELGTSLASGATGEVRVVLDAEVPAGPWQARLVLRSGTTEREAAGEVSFPDAPGERRDGTATADEGVGVARTPMPWVAAALAALVALAIGSQIVRRRRRLPEHP